MILIGAALASTENDLCWSILIELSQHLTIDGNHNQHMKAY